MESGLWKFLGEGIWSGTSTEQFRLFAYIDARGWSVASIETSIPDSLDKCMPRAGEKLLPKHIATNVSNTITNYEKYI